MAIFREGRTERLAHDLREAVPTSRAVVACREPASVASLSAHWHVLPYVLPYVSANRRFRRPTHRSARRQRLPSANHTGRAHGPLLDRANVRSECPPQAGAQHLFACSSLKAMRRRKSDLPPSFYRKKKPICAVGIRSDDFPPTSK